MMATAVQILFMISVLSMAMGGRVRRGQIFDVDVSYTHSPCIFKNKTGICVHETACDNEHNILPGGVVESTDFRNLNDPVDKCADNYWCCFRISTPEKATTELTCEPAGDREAANEENTSKNVGPPDPDYSDEQIPSDLEAQNIPKKDKNTCTNKKIDLFPDKQTTESSDTRKAFLGDHSNGNIQCNPLTSDECTFCALLYHADIGQRAETPFCLGALVGSNAIITAASCLAMAGDKALYVRFPYSSVPEIMYTVKERKSQPNYDSGTHAYDIALLVIENDETLQNTAGACLDFVEPLENENCVGYGFDMEWEMYSTTMSVNNASCSTAGTSEDAACGTNTDDVCLVDYGAPILCQEDESLVVRGVARGSCSSGQVLVGDIKHSRRWIEQELKSLGIVRRVYT